MEPSPQSPYTKQSSGLRPRCSFRAFAPNLRRETFPGRAFVRRPSSGAFSHQPPPGAFSGRAFVGSLLLPAFAGSLLPPASSDSLLQSGLRREPSSTGLLLLASAGSLLPSAFSESLRPPAPVGSLLSSAFTKEPPPLNPVRDACPNTLHSILVWFPFIVIP